MNLAGPILALVCAASWGAGDFFGGMASRAGGLVVALLLSQGMGTLMTLLLVAVSGEPVPPLAAAGWATVAGLCGLVGVGCLYLALSRGTMGMVAPLTALIAATVPAVIGILGGEPLSPMLAVGMLVALVAVLVISLPDRSDAEGGRASDGERSPRSGGARGREWLLILGAGLGFAGFFLGADRAHETGGGTFFTLLGVRLGSTMILVAVTLLLLGTRRIGPLRATRATVPLGLLAAVGDTGGNLFFILGNAVGSLSVTVVLASLYPVSTTLLARLVLHERLSPRRLAGVALALVGIVLVTAGALGPPAPA